MIASILMAAAFAVPLLILGLVVLSAPAHRTCRPSCTRLPVGPKRELSLGGPAIVVAAESVQAGGQGSNRNPPTRRSQGALQRQTVSLNLSRDLTEAQAIPPSRPSAAS